MCFAYIPEAAQTASSAACSGNEHLGNTGFPRGKIFFLKEKKALGECFL